MPSDSNKVSSFFRHSLTIIKMRYHVPEIFTFTSLFPEQLSRNEELQVPITAKCLLDKISHNPGDVFAAGLKIEILSGSNQGENLAAWNLVQIFSAARKAHVDDDGWCIFTFHSFNGRPVVLQPDVPKKGFKFRFVTEFYVMRERKGEDLDMSIRGNGRVERVGSCIGSPIEVIE